MSTAKTYTALTTLTVKKGASSESVTFRRFGNGDMEFVDPNLNNKTVRVAGANVEMKALFEAINGLV